MFFSTSTNVSMKKCKINSSLALRFTAGALINDIIENLTTPIVISEVQNLFFIYNVIHTFSRKFLGRHLGMTRTSFCCNTVAQPFFVTTTLS